MSETTSTKKELSSVLVRCPICETFIYAGRDEITPPRWRAKCDFCKTMTEYAIRPLRSESYKEVAYTLTKVGGDA